jgi:molybdate transport system substrate-binding protein
MQEQEDVMRTWSKIVVATASAGCVSVFVAAAAGAAEIKVLSTGSVQDLLAALAPAFERVSGHKLVVSIKSGVEITSKVKAGDDADLVIAGVGLIDDLVTAGKIPAANRRKVLISGVGVAVRAGAPKPDISAPEKLKAALLAAKSVAYSSGPTRGPSGRHFASVIVRLGIAEQMKPKTVLVEVGPVGVVVANGQAEIGAQQISELLPVPGVELVGPLPGDLQQVLIYTSGIPASAKNAAAAKAFVNFLTSEAAVPEIKKKGLEPGGNSADTSL